MFPEGMRDSCVRIVNEEYQEAALFMVRSLQDGRLRLHEKFIG